MRVVAAMIAIGMVLVACGNDPAADLPVAAASPVEASPTGEPSPSEDPSPSPEAAPSPEPSPTASPAASPPPDVAPGFGEVPSDSFVMPEGYFPFALSRDGTKLFVDGEHPDGVGCEESEPYALQLYDLATGDITVDLDPSLGLFGPFRGPGDRVLFIVGCEGFLGRVMVGVELADGRIAELVDVPLPTTDGPFSDPTAVSWTPQGELVWVVLGGGADLVTTDLAGNETRDRVGLNVEHYVLAATTSDVWSIDYRSDEYAVVGLRSGDRFAGYDDLAEAPALDAVLALGDAGVRLIRGDGSSEVWISDPVGDDVVWRGATLVAADLAYAVEDRSQPPDYASDRMLHAIGPDGIIETIDVGADSVPGPMLSADGDRLVYVVFDEGSGESRVVVRDRV